VSPARAGVFELPVFASARYDEKKQSLLIEELVLLLPGRAALICLSANALSNATTGRCGTLQDACTNGKWRKAAGVEPTRKRLAPPPGFEAQSHRRVRVPSSAQARRPVGSQCCMACRARSRRPASQQPTFRINGRNTPSALSHATWGSSPVAWLLRCVDLPPHWSR
jgi:hypothetical protein